MNKKILKRIVALLTVTALLAFSVPVYAASVPYEGKCGPSLEWKYELETRTLTISGEGPMYNYKPKHSSFGVAPWIAITTGISTVVIEEGCTTVGDYAFAFCIIIDRVYFPENSLKEIGQYAFYRNSKLSRLIIPDSVTRVKNNAFESCPNLVYLDFGAGISEVENNMCYGDEELRTVKFGKNCKRLGINSFYECINLHDIDLSNLETIDVQCFYGCTSMKEAHMGGNFKKMAQRAFSQCSSLTDITFEVAPIDISYDYNYNTPVYNSLEDGFYTICNGEVLMTKNSSSLTLSEYTVPDGVRVIGGGAFRNISGLKKITVPDGVVAASSYSFSDAKSLTSVSLPPSLSYIGKGAFGYSYSSGKYIYLTNLTLRCRGCSPALYEYCNSIGAKLICEHTFDEITLSSDCEEGTYTIKECVFCKHREGLDFFEPEGHRFIVEQKEGSCTENRVVTRVCTVCGKREIISEEKAEGHKADDEWSLVVDPTCNEYGYVAKVCTVCGEPVEKIFIEKIPHKLSEEAAVATPPTCVRPGKMGHYCELCGECFGEYEIPAAGHEFGEYIPVTFADPETGIAGFYIRVCESCGVAEGKWLDSEGNEVDSEYAVEKSSALLAGVLSSSTFADAAALDYDTNGFISTGDSLTLRKTVFSETDATEETK